MFGYNYRSLLKNKSKAVKDSLTSSLFNLDISYLKEVVITSLFEVESLFVCIKMGWRRARQDTTYVMHVSLGTEFKYFVCVKLALLVKWHKVVRLFFSVFIPDRVGDIKPRHQSFKRGSGRGKGGGCIK